MKVLTSSCSLVVFLSVTICPSCLSSLRSSVFSVSTTLFDLVVCWRTRGNRFCSSSCCFLFSSAMATLRSPRLFLTAFRYACFGDNEKLFIRSIDQDRATKIEWAPSSGGARAALHVRVSYRLYIIHYTPRQQATRFAAREPVVSWTSSAAGCWERKYVEPVSLPACLQIISFASSQLLRPSPPPPSPIPYAFIPRSYCISTCSSSSSSSGHFGYNMRWNSATMIPLIPKISDYQAIHG